RHGRATTVGCVRQIPRCIASTRRQIAIDSGGETCNSIRSGAPVAAKRPKGTVDTVPGIALLHADPDTGEAEHARETDVCWDDERTETDAEGWSLLTCHNGHRWGAEMG